MTQPRENKLKAIAGLIQGLTYAEMTTLSKQIVSSLDDSTIHTAATGLLQIAQNILAEKEVTK
ncbi:hypothetical protein [Rhizobium sp. Leaf383]|uniref:hypothetical protein n=1 Tax=Rhizobium sp. Leaf383 TaxID=1736357 RepID=UPI000715D92F|nr:hypothetical protein [Rhizobium sp. Leaf383]KQS84326.1 hypothetical protein ASG58_21385 [Rhizobium sp. Leaf383]